MVKHRIWPFVTASLLVLGLFVPVASAGTIGAGKSSGDKSALVKYKLSHGYLVGDQARFNRLTAAAAARAARLHPGVASSDVGPNAPIAGPSWEGLFEDDLAPPDPTDAIGPSSFIQAINLQLGIYNRSGGLIVSAPFSALTGSGADFLSDPQIIWDVHSNRFYYLILDVGDLVNPRSTMLWGFSKSSNPTSIPGGFCNYETEFGWGGTIADYPKLGQTQDFLLVGVNIYPTAATFTGADVGWITKPQKSGPIANCPSAGSFKTGKQTRLKTSDGTTLTSTPEPGVQIDPRPDGWIVDVPDPTNSGASGTKLELYHVTKNPDGTANIPQNATSEVTVPFYSPPAPAPQKNGQHPIDTLDGRLTHAVSAVDPAHGSSVALWTGHTIFGGAGAEFRWYEINVANATLFQSGDVTDPVLYAYNGAISSDRVGGATPSKGSFGSNMVLGFTTSSTTSFPAIQMVSKLGASAQSGFVLIKQSPGPEEGFDCFELGRCRWGDYGGALPDPIRPGRNALTGRVWLSNMWASGAEDPFAATWRTWNWGAAP